ncbi:hypothetical protein L1887_21616 [Cichorium endivia]|nr:hypothetical protein L1887_21616 [Cichorium endivia]
MGTALNHVKTTGVLGDGFDSTIEMCKKNLFWVVTKMQHASMTLEYRRECRKDNELKSITLVLGDGKAKIVDSDHGGIADSDSNHVDCRHLLLFQGDGGGEIVKGRTERRPEYENQI